MTRIQTCNETLLFVQDVNKYLKINKAEQGQADLD